MGRYLYRFDLFNGELHVMEYPAGRYLTGSEEREALQELALNPKLHASLILVDRTEPRNLVTIPHTPLPAPPTGSKPDLECPERGAFGLMKCELPFGHSSSFHYSFTEELRWKR